MTEPRDRPATLLSRFERFLDAVIPPPDEIADLTRRGEALLASGDAAGALRLSETALAAAPAYLRAILLNADALSARGQPYDALTVLENAARDRALPPPALARVVEAAARLGDERKALEYEAHTRARARDRDPEAARRLVSGAAELIQRGAHAAGLRLARGATIVDPELGTAWLLLAQDALGRGDAVQGRRALDRALAALDPTDAHANRVAGELLLGTGELVAAARHLRRAWIDGDQAAVAPLVVALSRSGDHAALERVVADAEGPAARTARALTELGSGDERARAALASMRGDELPDALWPLALEAAVRAAPDIAERWAAEAPARAGSTAVTALPIARSRLAAGDALGAREALRPALADRLTSVAADALYRDACRAAWRAQLPVMLEELAASVRESPALANLEAELRARRRELDDPLRVAILGEFSAGKSTFLNALVGAAVSPMGVLPTTAYVHWLRFGEPGARIVDSRGGAVVATIDEAPRIVERKRAAGEIVAYVEVTLPIARLARIELIDTPGFNAGDPAHEAAVRRAFEIADVALWLFDARQAGKLSETGPLEEAREANLPVVGVLNKIDQVRDAERAKLLAVVREGFRELAPIALAVSAREALSGTLALAADNADDTARSAARERVDRSGWTSLLTYLDEHLVAQRAAWKQLRIARRARELVVAAEALLTEDATARRGRADRREALLATIVALREQLLVTAATVRRDVGAILREQLRGLENGRARGARDDAQALASDAAAEIGFRARARALTQLAARLREIERLASESGLVASEAAPALTAPVVTFLDAAAAEGVRDATSGAPGPAFAPSDPVAALEQAVLRRYESVLDPQDAVRSALAVAREELSAFRAPGLPEPNGPAPSVDRDGPVKRDDDAGAR